MLTQAHSGQCRIEFGHIRGGGVTMMFCPHGQGQGVLVIPNDDHNHNQSQGVWVMGSFKMAITL